MEKMPGASSIQITCGKKRLVGSCGNGCIGDLDVMATDAKMEDYIY